MEQAILDVVYLNYASGTSKAGRPFLRLTCATLDGEVMTVFPEISVVDELSDKLGDLQPFDKIQLIGYFTMGFNGWRFILKDIK